jgi:hypothetical protein
LFAAAMNVARVLKRLRAENSLACVEDRLMPLTEYYALVDLDGALDRERRYHEAALTLAASPRTARKADPSSPLGAHAMEHGDNPGIHDAGAGP